MDQTADSNDAHGVTRHPGLLLVLNTEKGRGIFAKEYIPGSTVIEVSPVLVLPPSEVPLVEKTMINHYSYNWPYRSSHGDDGITQAIALGLGSIFNHSTKGQNVGFRKDVKRSCIVYSTLRDINPGEELCISYGPRLWFQDVDPNEVEEEDSLDITRIAVDKDQPAP